jgi:argininosuccinate lyase
LQTIEPRATSAVYEVLSTGASAASRTSYGGTAPSAVRSQIQIWKERLA